MKTLTKYFKRKEFECFCGCGQDWVDYELMLVLDMLRSHFNKPIKINSGSRCFNHNHKIGGSPHSQHLLGKAADIVVKDVKPQAVYDFLDAVFPDCYGIGLYNVQGFVHFDVRKNRARW